MWCDGRLGRGETLPEETLTRGGKEVDRSRVEFNEKKAFRKGRGTLF